MRIALFASGAGSNVKNIIDYFKNTSNVTISSVYSNKESAGALNHAREASISTRVFSSDQLKAVEPVLSLVNEDKIELIVLAGFLLKIPEDFIKTFKGDIINLHPSLLPKYGGKGMYGNNVHRAVLAAKEKKTGITIHYVNEHYDRGAIIKQFETALSDQENIETIGMKIKELEKNHFPPTIEQLIVKQ